MSESNVFPDQPRNTTVSISPSDAIVESNLVMLTCSSDANPPVHTYTWYKNGTGAVSLGQNYTITNISSEDSGQYYCKAGNEVGERISTETHLNVKYKPRNTSIFISPSGDIVEGSSVALTCHSDASPPVHTYTWYKNGTGAVSLGQNYTITNISSEFSGQYYCRAENEIGDNNSTVMFLNVKYPPKSPTVSISPSGEIVEGSSVTLTCSSDANPPVHTFTWYKKNGAEVTFKVKNKTDYTAVGVTVAVVSVFWAVIIVLVIVTMRKRNPTPTKDLRSGESRRPTQESVYENIVFYKRN
ncbi:B-cell receptor CD22-like [Chanos chanos]|uniref:B-cell receptor CD22-like n=1 Tax=Chanos chanos TaxID=29144 RepID=A0A6J2W0G9_CHACN|nr:B-cell receptor CD22-like [Chanos chanos]